MLKNKHATRAFVAFLVTWSFLVLTVTGLVLYVVPQGRIAHWSFWTLGGLDKDGWTDVHILFGAVFIATGALHLYFNWPAFVRYVAERARGHLAVKRELLTSLAATLLLLLGALFAVPPVSWIFELNDWVKASWSQGPGREPPYAHAEASSLPVLAKRLDIELESAISALRAQGIRIDDPMTSLEALARANHTTPATLYAHFPTPEMPARLEGESPLEIEMRLTGTGLGRKSIAELAAESGLSTDAALRRLRAIGVSATGEDDFRSLAQRYETRPIEIAKAMLVPGYAPAASGWTPGGD